MSKKAKWSQFALTMNDKTYALLAEGNGGLKVGIWDWEGRMSMDGVPRVWWSPSTYEERKRMKKDLNKGLSLLEPIPEDALDSNP